MLQYEYNVLSGTRIHEHDHNFDHFHLKYLYFVHF